MSKRSFILSSAGLKNLVQNHNYENEFTFIFGEHEIKMNNIFAEFISPYISQIHLSDPTIDLIHFPNKNSTANRSNLHFLKKITKEAFSLFESICKGESIEIDKLQCFQLQIISILLKNNELFSKLDELFPIENNDENKIIKELEFLSFLQENSESIEIFDQSKSIEYIAQNFHSIEHQKFFELPKTVFYSIIKNKELTIENEDSLLDLIEQFFQKNQEENDDQNGLNIIDFYEEVNFDFLSENKFKEFIEKFDSNQITTWLWNKLKKCFYIYKNSSSSLSKSENENSSHHHHYTNLSGQKGIQIEFDGKPENAFKGIIRYLTNKAGGNVNDKNFVNVTGSTTSSDQFAKYAVDLDDCTHIFHSKDCEDSWLLYDFQKRKVLPTHYTIRSRHNNDKNGYNPKNWVIEGSNDNKNWITLDSRQEETCLDHRNAVHTFEIKSSQKVDDGFRYLRMRQTDLNTAGYDHLILSALEYFGTLIEE